MKENSQKNSKVDQNKLTEGIIANSLNFQDWLKQLQPEENQAIVKPPIDQHRLRRTNPYVEWMFSLVRGVKKSLGRVKGQEFIEILNVEQFGYEASDFFWGGWCDSPKRDSTYQGKTLFIRGWVIGKQSPVVAIRLMIAQTVMQEFPVNLSRQDVVNTFSFLPARNYGFQSVLNFQELPEEANLRVVAVFEDGQTEAMALVKFYRY